MMKLEARRIIVLSWLLLPYLFYGCFSDDFSDDERERFWEEYADEIIQETADSAVLLGYKYDLPANSVEEILYDYLSVYDKYDYQLITKCALDIEELLLSLEINPPPLSVYIMSLSAKSNFKKPVIAGIILDYQFLKYKDQWDSFDSRIEDLEMDLEN